VRKITNDLDEYNSVSLRADSEVIAAVQIKLVSSLWVAPNGDPNSARQIASEVGSSEAISWTPDRRIIYRSSAFGSSNLWVIEPDGTGARQLTNDASAQESGLSVSSDGRHIVFTARRAGNFSIWRVDIDGGNLKQLTSGNDALYPRFSPDGQWVVYERRDIWSEAELWKVSIESGKEVRLVSGKKSLRPAVSPDGKLIAFFYVERQQEKSQWGIGVISIDGGPIIKRFDLAPAVTERILRWTPDGRSLAFVSSQGSVSNIWLQRLDGGLPKQFTNFKTDKIFTFDWSHDGKQIAFTRGVEASDVVLIRNFK